MKQPLVSIVMAAFNAQKYIRESIDSILDQTFQKYEFIIIDDGSTDNTVEILNSYSDSRLIIIRNERNIGLAGSLNKGLDKSIGKYIARMDADDISEKNRIEKQVLTLEEHPEIGICGTWCQLFGELAAIKRVPVNDDNIRIELLSENPFIHPTVMLRKEIIEHYKLRYDSTMKSAQDYNLWLQFAMKSVMHNIPEVLLKYRIHFTNTTKIRREEQLEYSKQVVIHLLEFLIEDTITPDYIIFNSQGRAFLNGNPMEFDALSKKILLANYKMKFFNKKLLLNYLCENLLFNFYEWRNYKPEFLKLIMNPVFKKIPFKSKASFAYKAISNWRK